MALFGKREHGKFGEDAACDLLKKANCKILERNFSVHQVGEIDIIAQKDSYILFVEVKTRGEGYLYRPMLAVDRQKQEKICKTALLYMQKHPQCLQPRFDVIEIYTYKEHTMTKVYKTNWIENAFTARLNMRFF